MSSFHKETFCGNYYRVIELKVSLKVYNFCHIYLKAVVEKKY